MREPRYSILADIQDAIEQAKQGKLALFWQRTLQREYRVLDRDASPAVRREAALLAQKELAKCMQEWDISLLNAPVPEQMKYASLAEAASHLMQVLNDPESITG